MGQRSYLVVVVGQRFPVVIANHFPLMMERVVLHIELGVPGLLIYRGKVLFPRNSRGVVCIQVHPHKAHLVDVNVYLVQTVLFLVKGRDFLILGRLCQLAVKAV